LSDNIVVGYGRFDPYQVPVFAETFGEVAVGDSFNRLRKPKTLVQFKPKLIGLAGYGGKSARVGKDTVADMLTETFCVKQTAFADRVRAAVASSLNMTLADYLLLEKEEVIEWLGKSRRQLEQTLGTEWGRELVNQHMWEILVERDVDSFHNNGYHAVVKDIRFESEAALVRRKGGVVWHIDREAAPAANPHISEQGIQFRPDLGDVKIDNNGTLAELFDEVSDNF
jgi:hypothetical protein